MFDAIVATCMRRGFGPLMFPARQINTIVSVVSGGVGIALVKAWLALLASLPDAARCGGDICTAMMAKSRMATSAGA